MKERKRECVSSYPEFDNNGKLKFVCVSEKVNTGSEKKTAITEEMCAKCPHYRSRNIEYPIQVDRINVNPLKNDEFNEKNIGRKARLQLTEDYVDPDNTKFYEGTFIGDIAIMPYVSYQRTVKELNVGLATTPGFFVQELNRLVCGSDCFWEFSEEQDTIVTKMGITKSAAVMSEIEEYEKALEEKTNVFLKTRTL